MNTACDSPGAAVFADGSDSLTYRFPFRSCPKKASDRFRCAVPSKDDRDFTDTSPKRIIPQNAHDAIAHMQASKGVQRSRLAFNDASINNVTGGLGGLVREPFCSRSMPRSDQLIISASWSDSGGGQP